MSSFRLRLLILNQTIKLLLFETEEENGRLSTYLQIRKKDLESGE